jgi:anaerobic selenocysteine-containing dehydrogenase
MAPGVGSHDPDVALLVGKNPLVSHLSWCGSPGDMVKDIDARGASLIVIDPRRTETAKRASIHLQTRPGYDALLLAAMIRVIFDEDLYDHDFVAENVTGVEELRRTVALVDPAAAAETAGVPIDDLMRAARMYARAQRAFGTAGTGANMTGDATMVEYLLLCLQSLCGFWLRAGDSVNNATTLTPLSGQPAKAQASPPRPPDSTAEPSRVRGLGQVGP